MVAPWRSCARSCCSAPSASSRWQARGSVSRCHRHRSGVSRPPAAVRGPAAPDARPGHGPDLRGAADRAGARQPTRRPDDAALPRLRPRRAGGLRARAERLEPDSGGGRAGDPRPDRGLPVRLSAGGIHRRAPGRARLGPALREHGAGAGGRRGRHLCAGPALAGPLRGAAGGAGARLYPFIVDDTLKLLAAAGLLPAAWSAVHALGRPRDREHEHR